MIVKHLGVCAVKQAVFDAVVPPALLQGRGQHHAAVPVAHREVHVPANIVGMFRKSTWIKRDSLNNHKPHLNGILHQVQTTPQSLKAGW